MDKIAIVYGNKDLAGLNVATQLREIGVPNWAKLYELAGDSTHLPFEKVMEDTVIVLSRHRSAAGTKSLTAHHLGNFGKAELGGVEAKLAGVAPRITTNFVRGFAQKKEKLKLDDFTICFEVTHHGPLTDKHVSYIELGSSEKEWENIDYARIVAENVIDSTMRKNNDKIVIGIGGGHYAPDFTKLSLRQPFSFGHICPKYALEFLNEDLLNQMIEKSSAELIVLDWKGLKENKERVVALCEKSGLIVERVQKMLKQ